MSFVLPLTGALLQEGVVPFFLTGKVNLRNLIF